MILTGREIANEVMSGRISIDPFDEKRLNPNSYNIRIGSVLSQYEEDAVLDTRHKAPTRQLCLPETGLVLRPNELYLGHTVETVGSDFFVPFIGGRSSTGRLGLFVHITAPLGDIGYVGQWTLQLRATVPVRIYPHQEIGQMFFVYPHGPIDQYKGKYQGGAGPQAFQPSELHSTQFPQTPLDPYSAAPGLLAALPRVVSERLHEEARQTAQRALSIAQGGPLSVLDVGCGAGFVLDALERSPRVSKLVGIDSSSAVLGYAASHLSRTLLVRDDVFAFEFEPHQFDIIGALAFLHLFPKRHVALILRRMRELLAPQGILIASTSLHAQSEEGWAEKKSLPGAWRFRSRYTFQEWRDLFATDWLVLDEWRTNEIMDPASDKTWHYIIAAARQ